MNNYEKAKEAWRRKALEWDFEERFQALGLPGYNQGNLPITYYGKQYLIMRGDASILPLEDPNQDVDFNTAMAIYHLFYYSKKNPKPSYQFVPLRDVKRAGPFASAFEKQTLVPFAKAFDGRIEDLIRAGEKLGWARLPFSDAGFQAMVFPFLPIRFLFWDGDDEFPARANVLFDANITDFTHEETAIMIASDGLHRLQKEAESPMSS